jgi:hypothetical protein
MFPHERSLVQKLDGKPFVLLGINSDPSRQEAKRTANQEDLPFRSWYIGAKRSTIARNYHVEGLPTLYLLDAQGVIRRQYLGPPSRDTLDRDIEELLKELQPKL